jgi:glycosyltransferase involved in cell wall biosynthesis
MIVHQDYFSDGRVRRYAESLLDARAQVDVVCIKGDTRQEHSPATNLRVYTIPLRRAYGGQRSYFVEYGVALILYTIWLLWLHIRHRYHVIHVHNMPDFLIFAALIPRLLGARLILDIHDPMPEMYMSKYQKTESNNMIRAVRLQEKLSSKLAHKVITANKLFRERLISRGMPPGKITVVNNVPDRRIFNRARVNPVASANDDHFTLIYPGTIAPRYRLDVPIRALPQLAESIPNIQLKLLGRHVDHVDELLALAKELGVEDHVEYAQVVPVDEVPSHLAGANVGLYTPCPDPHMDLTLPTKLMEYAVMGLPAIASDMPALRTWFDEESLLFFEPANVERFAECALKLRNDPSLGKSLVQRMDETFVRQYSWENEWQRYFTLLQELLQRSYTLTPPKGNDA